MKKCFQVQSFPNCTNAGLLILRLVSMSAMAMHGWGKIQAPMNWMPPGAPVPGVFQFLAAFSEFFGAIFILLGLLTRLSALGLTITMLVAASFHAVVNGDPFVSATGGASYELAAIYLAISLFFMLAGPGDWSLDKKIFGEKK